jgi:hypothetical protein
MPPGVPRLPPGAFCGMIAPEKPRVETRGLRPRKPSRRPCRMTARNRPVQTHIAWHPGRHATRSPPASAGGFLCDGRAREAPGGNPGTPGVKTTPPSMLDDRTRCPGSNPRSMAPGKACDPESPGFRRGLFVRWSRPKSPGWKPGDSGCENHPAVHAASLNVSFGGSKPATVRGGMGRKNPVVRTWWQGVVIRSQGSDRSARRCRWPVSPNVPFGIGTDARGCGGCYGGSTGRPSSIQASRCQVP